MYLLIWVFLLHINAEQQQQQQQQNHRLRTDSTEATGGKA